VGQASWLKSGRKCIGVYTPTDLLGDIKILSPIHIKSITIDLDWPWGVGISILVQMILILIDPIIDKITIRYKACSLLVNAIVNNCSRSVVKRNTVFLSIRAYVLAMWTIRFALTFVLNRRENRKLSLSC